MKEEARIATLRDHHANLDARIDQEQRRPYPDWLAVTRLKREKLRVKEEIERLELNAARWRGQPMQQARGVGEAA